MPLSVRIRGENIGPEKEISMAFTEKLTWTDIETALKNFQDKVLADVVPAEEVSKTEYLRIRRALSRTLDDLAHQPPKLAFNDEETEIEDITTVIHDVATEHGVSRNRHKVVTFAEFTELKEALLNELDKMVER